jgi:hypothetical protein
MFPFDQNLRKYTPITEEEALRTLAGHYPRGIMYEVEKKELPDSLQKIETLVAAFVSGVRYPVTEAPKEGDPQSVIFTVRLDMKDAPETGNLNAYLLLRVGEKVLMSPPCYKLALTFPHHFCGRIPVSGAFKQ